MLGADFVLGGQVMHDFVAHSVVYAAVEVYHHIVAESHIFLDASHTAVVRLLRTALVYCPATHHLQLTVLHLTLMSSSTTKPPTLIILRIIIQVTSPKKTTSTTEF